MISEPVISQPFNVQHNIHIEIDPNAPMGLRGLPQEWIDRLAKAEVQKEDIAKNPEVMMSIIA